MERVVVGAGTTERKYLANPSPPVLEFLSIAENLKRAQVIQVQCGSPPCGGIFIYQLAHTRRTTLIHEYFKFFGPSLAIRQGNLHSTAMSTLRERVRECVVSEGGGAVGRCLVGHALGSLRRLAAQPGTKAVARVFETPHPYQNMMVSDRPDIKNLIDGNMTKTFAD